MRVTGRWPFVYLEGAVNGQYEARDARPGQAVQIGMSCGASLCICWEPGTKEPRIYILDRGDPKLVRWECQDGDGTPHCPTREVKVWARIDWVMVQGVFERPTERLD